MKRCATTFLVSVLLATMVLTANAYTLRAPQVVFSSAPLQSYFNGLGEGFNVATDQADIQVWSTNVTGNSDFTLVLKNGVQDEIGIYNSADPLPNLYLIFPPGAAASWSAYVQFIAGNLKVSLYDNTATFQGTTVYSGVSSASFAFYLKSANGTYFSQDYRNGRPMVLTYAGVSNPGDWWLCFQDVPYPLLSSAFDSAVIDIQSVRPVPVRATSFGHLKSLYR